jgi:hypothetical protein
LGEGHRTDSSREQPTVANNLEGVAGWLLFLCLALTIIAPVVELYSLFQEWSVANAPPELQSIVITETCFGGVLNILGVAAGICLWTRSADAIYVARLYLIALLAGSALQAVIIGAEVDSAGIIGPRSGYVSQAIAPIISAAIWLVYLARSRRVRATYGLQPRPAITRRSFREFSKPWLPLERIAFAVFTVGAATSL